MNDRYIVTFPMTFTANNGETDDWKPGEQFIVLERKPNQTIVQRGARTGWIYTSDLEIGSKPTKPGTVAKGRAKPVFAVTNVSPKAAAQALLDATDGDLAEAMMALAQASTRK